MAWQAASKQPMIPYRENGVVKYAPTVYSSWPISGSTHNDNDDEPLIPSELFSELEEQDVLHFTATGRPMPAFKASGLMNLGSNWHSLPQLLPIRYTDDSIIPAIVVDVVPSEKNDAAAVDKKKGGFLKKFKGEKKRNPGEKVTKIVYMPRRDYLKWFARDAKGVYIGTEPQRLWTEDDLETTFRQYKPPPRRK